MDSSSSLRRSLTVKHLFGRRGSSSTNSPLSSTLDGSSTILDQKVDLKRSKTVFHKSNHSKRYENSSPISTSPTIIAELDNHDLLDVGSLTLDPPTGEARAQKPAEISGNAFKIDGIRATSLFGLFEERLTEISRNHKDSIDPFRRTQSNASTREILVDNVSALPSTTSSSSLKRSSTVHVTTAKKYERVLKKKTGDISEVMDKKSSIDSGIVSLSSRPVSVCTTNVELEERGLKSASLPDLSLFTEFHEEHEEFLSQKNFPQKDGGIKEEVGGDGVKKIISAKLDVLYDMLCNPLVDETYPDFTRDFLLTYRYHSSEEEFWSRLHLRFQLFNEKLQNSQVALELDRKREFFNVLLRITLIMHSYLTEYTYLDYNEGYESIQEKTDKMNSYLDLLKEISVFIETNLSKNIHKPVRIWAGPLRQAVLKIRLNIENPADHANGDTENISGFVNIDKSTVVKKKKPNRKTNASLLSISPFELFSQLTLNEVELYSSIRPLDLYHKSKGRLNNAPNLKSLIHRFNQVSYWVATEICMCRDVKIRALVLKHFIKIAQLCCKWNNYNTCLQITAALSMTCVQRLKKTWKALPAKYHVIWRELSTTFSAHGNYSAYRKDILAKLDEKTNLSFRGVIPFMGVHLSDLIFIEEGNGKDYFENGMLNFKKLRLIAATFKKLVDLQKITRYPFIDNPFTKRFLIHDTFLLDEDKLWKASRICEPPEASYMPRPIRISNDDTSIRSLETSNNSLVQATSNPKENPESQLHSIPEESSVDQNVDDFESRLSVSYKSNKDQRIPITRSESMFICINSMIEGNEMKGSIEEKNFPPIAPLDILSLPKIATENSRRSIGCQTEPFDMFCKCMYSGQTASSYQTDAKKRSSQMIKQRFISSRQIVDQRY